MAEAKKKTEEKNETKSKSVKKAEVIAETFPVDVELESKLEVEKVETKATAKAGKRSAKVLKETEEKQAKEVRKSGSTTADAPKTAKLVPKPPRSRADRTGKNYKKAAELVDKNKSYSLSEAIELAIKTNPSKFDASVELHVNLGVDPKQADQNIRGMVVLPSGSGKSLRVAVLTEDTDAAEAKKAGADIAGLDSLLAQLEKEEINFDILIATPQLMSRLAKYARLLGPRGLMPNPKSGTVTNEVGKAIKEAKAGRIEYRTDEQGIIHTAIGKSSFKPADLEENAQSLLAAIRAAKPASLKGSYIRSIYLATTMWPSIKTETTT